MTFKGYFISDLHMFSRRSHAHLHSEDIFAAAGGAHTFVLGGDIFDFKWSTLASMNQTIDAAIEWLSELVIPHADCDFHFILGNHDANPAFVQRLDRLTSEVPQLSWHRYFLRLGDCLFLHGDILDSGSDHGDLDVSRERWHDHGNVGQLAHALYDAAVHAKMHVLVTSLVNRRRAVLRKVFDYLHEIGQGPETGIRHVYFGHTHRELVDVEYGGVTFHNPGAAIKGMNFRVVETNLTDRQTPGDEFRLD